MDERLDYRNYEMLLAEAGKFHGDVCTGIEIGTRMAMCGLREVGIQDPKGKDRKKLIVFVEIDRCATDAIMALTGCRPGRRTMKVFDYGKMAATFLNLETQQAVRVVTRLPKRPGSHDKPDIANTPEAELFKIEAVAVPLRPEDLPGKPLRRATCAACGDSIMDGREVQSGEKTLCKPCAEQRNYYQLVCPQ
jgi:formylmethanofuran dehydrogenase subunit E